MRFARLLGAPLVWRVSVWSFCALAGALFSTTGAHARGLSFATVAIPGDGQSTPVAVEVARIADETLASGAFSAGAGGDEVELLDLEKVLEGGDPLWGEKLAVAEAERRKALAALDAVELPVAADSFAEALVAYEQAVPGLKDMTSVVETLALAGKVFVLQGDQRSAKAMFTRALVLDPAYRIPKDGTPPRVMQVFDATAREHRRAGQGTLTVYSTTGAAEVWIDGVFRGIAPFTVDVGAGRHYVRVVRDGWLAWGAAADVKRGSETSVQASLRPTARLSKYEELAARVPRNKESVRPVAELAAALQVDRLLAVVVEESNGAALLTATLVDGVSGAQLARASKAFAPGDSFFERDVRNLILDVGRSAARGRSGGDGANGASNTNGAGGLAAGPEQTSLLPGEAEAVETPGAVIGGWVLVGTAAALAINTVVCGIVSYNLYDSYRNKLPSQLDPNLESIRTTWLTMSIITDASWILGAAAAAGGTTLLVTGYAEKAAQEEVVNP